MKIKRFVSSKSFKKLQKRSSEYNQNDDEATTSQACSDHQNLSVYVINDRPNINRDNSTLNRVETSFTSVSNWRKYQIKSFSFNSCRNIHNALQSMSSPLIQDELKSFSSILYIKFKINGTFMELSPYELKELNEKCKTKAAVIIFMSKNEDDFMVYWKMADKQRFWKLVLSEGKFSKNLCDFVGNFLAESLSEKHSGLKSTFIPLENTNQIEIASLADLKDYNLLLVASEQGKNLPIRCLIKTGLKSSITGTDITAQSLAYENNHFTVLLELLNSNLTYPPSFDLKRCPQQIKSFHETNRILHEAIRIENEAKIIQILDENPNLCYFYNLSNESAVKVAVANKSIHIYQLLVNRKLFYGPHENVDDLTTELNFRDRKTMREVNYKYLKSMPEKHLNILMAHSLIGSDVIDQKKTHDIMFQAFSILNKYRITKSILRVVAATRNFQVIFDFNRDSVHVLNPTAEQNTKGLYSTSGKIFIGAKELLDPSTEQEAFGTLAHELGHYALNTVYDNKAKPYYAKDKQRNQEFDVICKATETNSEKEKYIDLVYTRYPIDTHHAELIVRVPHLIALYHNQPEKIEELRRNFPQLFDFYENKVLQDLENSLPELKKKAEFLIEEQNKRIEVLKKRLYWSIVVSSVIIIIVVIIALFHEKFFEWILEKR